MTGIQPRNGESRAAITISVGALVWAALTLLYLALRVGPIWQAPVGGIELDGLSGAWQASNGVTDDRFYSTIAQWFATATLAFTESPVPARAIAWLAGATVPAALFIARRHIGDPAALAALFVISIDGMLIHLTTAASPVAFDIPLTLWLFVALLERERMPWWSWGIWSAIVVLSGPIALPLAAAAIVLFIPTRGQINRRLAAAIAVGIAIAILLTTIGPDGFSSPTVPALHLLADGFEQTWSTASGASLMALYGWPVLVLGLLSAAWLFIIRRGDSIDVSLRLTGLWALFGAIWLVVALASQQPLANAGFVLPAALLIGLAAYAALQTLRWNAWPTAWLPLLLAFIGVVVVSVPLSQWAQRDQANGSYETAIFSFGLLVIIAALGLLAWERATRPALAVFFVPLLLLFLLRGAFGVGLSGRTEPVPSPYSPEQARDLRALAGDVVREQGGGIVVAESLAHDATWPLRGSDITVATEPPPGAAILIWEALPQPPSGYLQIQSNWALVQRIDPPTGSVLDYVRWLTRPNSASVMRDGVSVYIGESE